MMNLSSLSKAKVLCGIAAAFTFYDFLSMVLSKEPFANLIWALISFSLSLAAFFFVYKAQKFILASGKVITDLSKGDFSARVLNITERGDLADLFYKINDMTDVMDAFVREATACMQAVNENRYYRQILPDGLKGSLLQGSQTINKALLNVGKKMSDFGQIARDVDISLTNVAHELTEMIQSLNTTAGNMESSVQQASQKTTQAIQGVEEAALAGNTISAASEEMSASISEISQQINRSSQISINAVEQATQAKRGIAELTETVSQIGQVVLLIQDIANQTNLLALNATIEAARAGDAGKGFAVVANEVKTLAAQTTEATDDIRHKISAIQHATEASSKSFEDISHIIQEMSDYTTNISAAIEEQSAASREIANSSQRSSEGTSSVSNNMGLLGTEIQLVNDATTQVANITNALSTQTIINIENLVTKMKTFMQELNKVA